MIIFLNGFMGSGKTYWGRIWSRVYDLPFFDLDELIAQQQQNSIAEIFEIHGEAIFREMETAALQTFSQKKYGIIACGGGTPCFNGNMHWMNENGCTVYLSASPQYLYNRLLEEKEKRPLIKKLNPAELLLFVEQKLKDRQSFYELAQLILPVDELNDNSIKKIIIS